MSALSRAPAGPAGTVLPASVEQALQRCILLASRFGTIRLTRPDNPERREFFLELDHASTARLRWTLTWVGTGTELTVSRTPVIARLASFGRHASAMDRQLERLLQLLPHIASLKIAVIGGGTGLYTTLLGLRDRTWNPTAVISGLPRGIRARDPIDHLGSLPRDDARMCMVGLTPTVEGNVVLRSLLSHRMESSEWRGAHFGTALLGALEEIRGSRQAAFDAAVELLGIRGRVVLALGGGGRKGQPDGPADDALAALSEADMIVIAPGHLEADLLPVLCCPGIIDAVRTSAALKVVVTKIMSDEHSSEEPVTSHEVGALATLTGIVFDVALVNSGPFTTGQLRAYAAEGARPIRPNVEATMAFTKRLLTEQLGAPGDLARHDPEQLGECLVQIGAEHLLTRRDLEAAQGA